MNKFEKLLYWIFYFILAAFVDLLFAFPVMYAWNYVFPYLFGWKMLDWGRSFCLVFILQYLWKIVLVNPGDDR